MSARSGPIRVKWNNRNFKTIYVDNDFVAYSVINCSFSQHDQYFFIFPCKIQHIVDNGPFASEAQYLILGLKQTEALAELWHNFEKNEKESKLIHQFPFLLALGFVLCAPPASVSCNHYGDSSQHALSQKTSPIAMDVCKGGQALQLQPHGFYVPVHYMSHAYRHQNIIQKSRTRRNEIYNSAAVTHSACVQACF